MLNNLQHCVSHHHGLESETNCKFFKFCTQPEGGFCANFPRTQFGAGMFSRHQKGEKGILPMVARMHNHGQKPIKREPEWKYEISIRDINSHFGWRILGTSAKIQCTNWMCKVSTCTNVSLFPRDQESKRLWAKNGYGTKHRQNPMQIKSLRNSYLQARLYHEATEAHGNRARDQANEKWSAVLISRIQRWSLQFSTPP